MLEEIAKKNKLWFKIALKICKDEDLAKDLVQDMYLIVYENCNKEINNNYVAKIIYNLFLKNCKNQNKTIRGISFDIKDNSNIFEPSDEEKYILDNLTFLEKELILLKEKLSYHDIEREYNINYQFARRKIIDVKKKYKKK